jgi:hypothetical protein
MPWLSTKPGTRSWPCSEVARLLREAQDTATTLLRGHRETLDPVIDLLLETACLKPPRC